jgi:hypothetical protein
VEGLVSLQKRPQVATEVLNQYFSPRPQLSHSRNTGLLHIMNVGQEALNIGIFWCLTDI